MNTSRLAVQMMELSFANPTLLASGILGYSVHSFCRVAASGAGAIVTKSIGLTPRTGYANPTIVQSNCGFINAMGLPNPGINQFVQEIFESKTVLSVPLIVSIYGYEASEYALIAKKAVEAGADAVELNVSCPHVRETGSEIGQKPELLAAVVRKVKAAIDQPIFVKLSPNVPNMGEIAESAVQAGADALTAINTVKAMAIDVDTAMPILSNRMGGLSGPAIKPIALRCVYDLYESVSVPIIGCGGVTNWRDAIEFLLAGATAIQVGTAVATKGLGVFKKIASGMNRYLKTKKIGNVKEIVGLAHKR